MTTAPSDEQDAKYRASNAVLLVAFNRPERLNALIEHIRRVAPPTVYVVVDGPRHADEVPAVEATRAAVTAIDWTTDVHTRFRPQNVGCRESVIDAVSWFLHEQQQGIVLEEDVAPTTSFFRFCDEMLDQYAHESSAQAVCGVNLVPPSFVPDNSDYRLSIMGPSAAWATWNDRWQDFCTNRFDRSPLATFRKMLHNPHGGVLSAAHWSALMVANRTKAMDSWAYPFMLFGMDRQRYSITPNRNLIEHQGIGEEATHMQEESILAQPAYELEFPLRAPPFLVLDPRAEKWSLDHEINATGSSLAGNARKLLQRLI